MARPAAFLASCALLVGLGAPQVQAQDFDPALAAARQHALRMFIATKVCYQDTAQALLMLGSTKDHEGNVTYMVQTCAPGLLAYMTSPPMSHDPVYARQWLAREALHSYDQIMRRGQR